MIDLPTEKDIKTAAAVADCIGYGSLLFAINLMFLLRHIVRRKFFCIGSLNQYFFI